MNCFPASPTLGAPLIAAEFPRAYCDVNRASGELDSGMFDAALDIADRYAQPRASQPAWASFPASCATARKSMPANCRPREAELRLSGFIGLITRRWRSLAAETRQAFWRRRGGGLPLHAVGAVGARYRAGRPLWRIRAAASDGLGGKCLRRQALFHRPQRALCRRLHHACCTAAAAQGLFGLQIEINRALYLDEDRIQRKPGFEYPEKAPDRTLARLTAIDPALLGGRAFPLAAE